MSADRTTTRCAVVKRQNGAAALGHPALASFPESFVLPNAPCRNRTCNLLIKSQLLCQLS